MKKQFRASSTLSLPAGIGSACFQTACLTLALAAACVFSPAGAQPTGVQAVHGSATVSQSGNQTTITTTNGVGTRHSSINWQSFSVPTGSITQFTQPSTGSTSINRVVGSNPSSIFGTLRSNGTVVLVNPAGIAFGAGSVVDTAGFTASTLRMSDADALAGRLVFGGDGASGGALQADGQILARQGDVVLISPNVGVGSTALIQASNGTTALVAGQKVEITGRGLEGIHLHVQAPADQAVNLGRLEGDAVGIFASTLKHSGIIQATAASAEGGRVVLRGGALADIGGEIFATRGAVGGQVHVTGDRVILRNGADVDVSGAEGGGEALFGGGWQGMDTRLANSKVTFMETGSVVRANATDRGDGGTVVFWSDDRTLVGGRIEAKGGPNGGDGGRVETSGKGALVFQAQVDTSAPMGQAGLILLDPQDIIISTAVTTSTLVVSGDGSLPTINAADFGPVDAAISEAALESLSGNLQLSASRDIVIQGLTDSTLNMGTAVGSTFSLTAGRNVQAKGMSIQTNGGDVSLNAQTGFIDLDFVGAGNVSLNAGGSIGFGNASTTTNGILSITSGASVTGGASTDDLLLKVGGSVSMFGFIRAVRGSAGGDIAISGVDTVAAPGLSAGGNVALIAPNRSQLASVLAFAPSGSGLGIYGNLTAGGDINLSGGSYVYVETGVTVSGANISMSTPQTYVAGTLQPGGVGGIGRVAISGDLIVASTGVVQLDVSSLTSYDTLDVLGASSFDPGGVVRMNDLSGGTLDGSFFPAFMGSGFMDFSLPVGWTAANPFSTSYLITAKPFVPTSQVESLVLNFQETWNQEQQEEETALGKDDIVITETQCKA